VLFLLPCNSRVPSDPLFLLLESAQGPFYLVGMAQTAPNGIESVADGAQGARA
jgi:hypothetical protein